VTVFGRSVKQRRTAAGLSQRDLARLAYIDPGYVARIEQGDRRPSRDVADAIDAALDAGGTLSAQLDATDAGNITLPGPGWTAADASTLAGLVATTPVTADNATALARAWLSTPAPQRFELDAGRRINAGMVAKLERRVHQLRLLDDHLSGPQTYEVVSAELDATAVLVREGRYTTPVGRALLAAVSELCQIAGWIASDAGRHGDARRHYLAGVRASHAAGDGPGAASNLSSLAYQEANVGSVDQARELATAAVDGAGPASATVRALLLERLAWAHARAGDPEATARTLDEVDDQFAARRPGEDPIWVYWMSLEEIDVMRGRCWTQLHRPLRAVPALEGAISRYPDMPREVSLYLTWLAESLIQAGEVDQAAATATRALVLARRSGSARAAARVAGVRRTLRRRRGAAVEAFEEAWRAAG
jgi:transcriptional regulator with XRE-family HTH domain/tetratricopeptide (TPR) repeat protein